MPLPAAKKASPTRVVDLFAESYDVYVGSPCDHSDPRSLAPGEPGFLGNPFSEGNPERNLSSFQEYFLKRVSTERRFYLAVLSLYGRRLGSIERSSKHSHVRFIADWLNEHRLEYLKQFELPKPLGPA